LHGWSACLQHLSEQGAGEFSEDAAVIHAMTTDFSKFTPKQVCIEMARWQHAQSAATLAAHMHESEAWQMKADAVIADLRESGAELARIHSELEQSHFEQRKEIAALKSEDAKMLARLHRQSEIMADKDREIEALRAELTEANRTVETLRLTLDKRGGK
jgi:predicted RNase H-like nuclease (RuvC/YqgF family)